MSKKMLFYHEEHLRVLLLAQKQTGIKLSSKETSMLLNVIDRFGIDPSAFISLKESGYSELSSWATERDRWAVIDFLLAGWSMYSDLMTEDRYDKDYVKSVLVVLFHQMFYASDDEKKIPFFYKCEKRVMAFMLVLRSYANNLRVIDRNLLKEAV